MVQEREEAVLPTAFNIETLREALTSGTVDQAIAIARQLPEQDLYDLLHGLSTWELRSLFERSSQAEFASLLTELRADRIAALLQAFTDVEVASVLDEFASDDAADIIQAIKANEAARVEPILVEMDRQGDVQPLLAHLPDTAGGIMTTDFLTVNPESTAGDAIRGLQERAYESEFRGYVYVTDHDGVLLGVVPLYRLVLIDPGTPVGSFMIREPITVHGTDDQQEVARIFQQRRFLALPVVDAQHRLIGVITADDVLDVEVEEATEDMYRMAGVGVQEHAFSPVLESATRRVPWLGFNMVWAFVGAFIISLFEGTLEKAAVLAVFMPMIAGQSGNAGIQTATIVVRSMALGEVDDRLTFRLLRKEWALSVIKGLIFGSILGLVAWLWKDEPFLGLIAGVAMFLNMIVAGTTGVVLPLSLRRLGFDPATIAGVFDTMLTDLMGFLIYLGLATLFISRLT